MESLRAVQEEEEGRLDGARGAALCFGWSSSYTRGLARLEKGEVPRRVLRSLGVHPDNSNDSTELANRQMGRYNTLPAFRMGGNMEPTTVFVTGIAAAPTVAIGLVVQLATMKPSYSPRGPVERTLDAFTYLLAYLGSFGSGVVSIHGLATDAGNVQAYWVCLLLAMGMVGLFMSFFETVFHLVVTKHLLANE